MLNNRTNYGLCMVFTMVTFLVQPCKGNIEFNADGIYIDSHKIYIGLKLGSLREILGEPTRILNNQKTNWVYDSLGIVVTLDSSLTAIEEFHFILNKNLDNDPQKSCGIIHFFDIFLTQHSPFSIFSLSKIKPKLHGFDNYIIDYRNALILIRTHNNGSINSISMISKWEPCKLIIADLHSKKIVTINEGDPVWLKVGKKCTPFILSQAVGNKFEFVSQNDNWSMFYTDSTLREFEITTFGSVTGGIIINSLAIGVYASNYIILPVASIFMHLVTFGKTEIYKPAPLYLGFAHFHSRVKIFSTKGDRLLTVRVIPSSSFY